MNETRRLGAVMDTAVVAVDQRTGASRAIVVAALSTVNTAIPVDVGDLDLIDDLAVSGTGDQGRMSEAARLQRGSL